MAQQNWQYQQGGAQNQSGGPGYYAAPGYSQGGRQQPQPTSGGAYQAGGGPPGRPGQPQYGGPPQGQQQQQPQYGGPPQGQQQPQYGAPQGQQPQYGAPQGQQQSQYGAPHQGQPPQYGAPQGQQPGGQPQYGQKRPGPVGGEQGPLKQQRQGGPGGYHQQPGAYGQGPGGGQNGAPPGNPQVQLPTPGAAGGPAGPAAASAPQAAAKDTYVVFTCGNDKEEVVVRTLVGEYVEKGVNHGRKVYQKKNEKQQPDYVDVLLYYWDSRDGAAFEGWWFGNKLGGTQVWSHCKDNTLLPPGAGWKIPWDGPIRQTLVVMNKEVQQKAEAEEKLQSLSGDVGKVMAGANAVMEQAKLACGGGDNPEGFAEAEKLLSPQVVSLGEVAKKVAEAQKFAVGDTVAAFNQLSNQVQKTQSELNSEYTRVRDARQKAEKDQVTKEAEDRDTKIFDELIPEATEKTNIAEDMVEKTVITSEMILACGEDLDMVRQAIEETEKSGKAAQAAIGEARIYLNAKLASTRRFTERVRERAAAELGKLQQQLQEAQNKLNPLKNVRTDWDQRRSAQKLVGEIEEKIVLAEVDVDRAEEMVSLLHGDSPTKEGLLAAHHSLQVSEDHVKTAMRTFETKKQSATGLSLEELMKLEPRGDAALKKIHSMRTSLKVVGECVTTDGYMEEASEKVQTVTDALGKLEDAEGQFADGSDVTLMDSLQAVRSSEAAAAAAQTASSMARMFIQMKTLEVKRFSSGPAQRATEKLQEYQKLLEVATSRLAELKGNISKRKCMALVKEAETRVAKAEISVEKMKEAASIFADDEKLMAMSADDIREASEKTAVCEKEANEALTEVRKFVTARQIEAKGKDASVEISAELIKFQTRLSTAQTEVSRQRKLFTSVEQRLAVKKILDEAEKKMAEAEEKVSKASAAISGLAVYVVAGSDGADGDAGDGSDKAVKDAELSVQEAQVAVRTMDRFFESQARSQGYAKDGLVKLEPRMKRAKEQAETVASQVKEQSEKIFVRGLVRDARRKVSECEEHLRKAVEAEQPLLLYEGGGSNLTPSQASTMVAELEKAVQVGQSLASSSKTFIAMKRLSVKRLSESASQSTNEELTKLHGAVDIASKKLADMRIRNLELKKSVLRASKGMPSK